ncbi:MAG: lamin tail domain-containing protein [bacterium]
MKQKTKQATLKALILNLIFAMAMNFYFVPATYATAPDHVVISEIQIAGGSSSDEFVEIYNPTGVAVDLTGWKLKKKTGSGVESNLVASFPTFFLGPNAHFLIVHQTGYDGAVVADMTFSGSSFTISNDNTILLYNSGDSLIDKVGYGAAIDFETSPSVNPLSNQSIGRAVDGQDTDNNSLDFLEQSSPTPQNSFQGDGLDSGLNGSVGITVTLDADPEQNITPVSADIVFSANGAGEAIIYYGSSDSYGEESFAQSFVVDETVIISLANLVCGTIYHYSIHAESASNAGDVDDTVDAEFETLDCGIDVNDLTMTKSVAKANNQYETGWEWEFDITVWDLSETSLRMKFDQWQGAGTLNAAGNMEFSVDNGAHWIGITENNAYPVASANISAIDTDVSSSGRQVLVLARMKIPSGSTAGDYYSNFGILTE